jgi:tetratricopeptide (TPR) repeat protein
LRGEPILARAEPPWRRFYKCARRNPAIASLSVSILLVTLLGFVAVLWQFQKTRVALRQSEIVPDTLKEFLPSLRPGLGDTERSNILYAVAEQLKVELKENPAMLNYLLGLINYSHGEYGLAEVKFREALQLYESRQSLRQADVADTLNSLGVMIQKQGADRRTEAEQMYRRSFKILSKIYDQNDRQLDEPRRNWALVLRRLQRFQESETLYREAWNIEQHRHGESSEQAAIASLDLIQVLLQERKYKEAEPIALAASETLKKAIPQSWQYFDACSLQGGCFLGEGRFAEAEPLLLSGVTGLRERFSFVSSTQFRELEDGIWRMQNYFEAIGSTDEAVRWKGELEAVNKQFSATMDAKAHKNLDPEHQNPR